jgi:hypothetical protein
MKMDYPLANKINEVLRHNVNKIVDPLDYEYIWKWSFQTEEFTLDGLFAASKRQVIRIPGKIFQFDHLTFRFRERDIGSPLNPYINTVAKSAEHVQWFKRNIGVIGVDLLSRNSLH